MPPPKKPVSPSQFIANHKLTGAIVKHLEKETREAAKAQGYPQPKWRKKISAPSYPEHMTYEEFNNLPDLPDSGMRMRQD